jgi:hypothetical protein
VPHFIDPDGLDLGPVVSASSRVTYYAPVGTTVEWGTGVVVIYREPGCRGAAWSYGGPPLPGAVPLLDGQLWRVAPESEPVGEVASAIVFDLAGRPACRELPHSAPDRHRLAPTGEPGRLYRDDELRVELR